MQEYIVNEKYRTIIVDVNKLCILINYKDNYNTGVLNVTVDPIKLLDFLHNKLKLIDLINDPSSHKIIIDEEENIYEIKTTPTCVITVLENINNYCTENYDKIINEIYYKIGKDYYNGKSNK